MANQPKPTAQPSIGFPALEKVVELDNFDDLNQVFIKTYDKLESIAQSKTDLKRKKSAKKAMRAMELTMNLLRDFLQVRDELMAQGQLRKE